MSREKIEIEGSDDQSVDKSVAVEKDLRLKRSFEEESLERQKKCRRDLWDLQAEKAVANQIQNSKLPHDDKKTYWMVVLENAYHLLEKEFSGYNDWALEMTKLIFKGMDVHKAIYYDPIDVISFLPYDDLIKAGINGAKFAAWDRVLNFSDTFLEKMGVSKKMLPTLRFSIDINDKGHVTTVTRENNAELSKEQQRIFDVGVAAWGLKNGYELQEIDDPKNKDNKVRVFTNGKQVMTCEEFKRLNQTGAKMPLDEFLSSRFVMGINQVAKSIPPEPILAEPPAAPILAF